MAAPTSLEAVVDLEEYSRFEVERNTITVTITPGGAGPFGGEEITVELVKARRNRDVVAATKTLTLSDGNPHQLTFELAEMRDEDNCARVRRGMYFVRAISVTDPLIDVETNDFRVSLISVERLKADYLHGTDQMASDILAIRDQPVLVTGVEVISVSRAHPQSWFPLTHTYNTDGAPTPLITHLLQWCSGPAVKVEPGRTRYVLRRNKDSTDFIEVRVDYASLPTDTLSEDLLVQRAPLSDARMQAIIDQAISWVEDVELHIYLEPTIIVTEVDPTEIAYASGTDVPTFVNSEFDKRVDAITYYRASPGHWINIRFPYYPIQKFESLYGKVSNTRILDVALEWVEFHSRGGFVELVPFNQEIAFNFIGLVWVESLRGPLPIPNFWNFKAKVGFCDTPPILLELVAKKAAMDILTIAGQAYRAGVSSQSVSRDGVSESVSYTASAIYGIYSATIEDYRKWVKETMKKMRGSFKGPNMFVV